MATSLPASSPRDKFESKVRRAKHDALLVAGVHLLSHFFGLCALTWATVVLLGGFAVALRPVDFFFISSLLLLEGSRLFIVQTFTKILSRTLFRESHRPEEFEFADQQSSKAQQLDLLGQAASSGFSTTSIIVCAWRFTIRHHSPLSANSPITQSSNLTYSLYIFYVLIFANSFLAVLCAALRPFLRCRCDGDLAQNSLMCFHDEVFGTAMNVGLPEADQLDILEYAYRKLVSDYKRNIRPPLIKAQNKDLISYLYHNQQGIAMACEYLAGSEDVWKQVVAANLPGFWAKEQRIGMQAALFWGLRKRMYGAGKDAESALNSIECLAQTWGDPETTDANLYPFLVNDPAVATTSNIIDALVLLLLKPIRPTLLFQLRAFEACCQNRQVLRYLYRERNAEEAKGLSAELQAMVAARDIAKAGQEETGELTELCVKLLSYLSQQGIWITTRIYAASALISLLCYESGEVGEAMESCLKGLVERYIDPAGVVGSDGKRPYFWLNDMILVEEMRRKLKMDRYDRWESVWMKKPDGTDITSKDALAIIANFRFRYKTS